MQDALMALQTDLASRIAIRYACRLEKLVRFNMQAIHIPDLDEKGHSPGGGWVHQTWENVIVQQAREDIAGLLQKELLYYSIGAPIIVPGERDQVILKEMHQKRYDFFIEGFLHSFEPDRFFQKLDSDLYRNISCPILMVKNLVDLNRGVQIFGTPDTVLSAAFWFCKLWSELPIQPDILVCHFEPSMEESVFIENDRDLDSVIEAGFLKYGKKHTGIRTVKGASNNLVPFVRNHALLVSPLPASDSQIAHMLAMSPCPILFCPEFRME